MARQRCLALRRRDPAARAWWGGPARPTGLVTLGSEVWWLFPEQPSASSSSFSFLTSSNRSFRLSASRSPCSVLRNAAPQLRMSSSQNDPELLPPRLGRFVALAGNLQPPNSESTRSLQSAASAEGRGGTSIFRQPRAGLEEVLPDPQTPACPWSAPCNRSCPPLTRCGTPGGLGLVGGFPGPSRTHEEAAARAAGRGCPISGSCLLPAGFGCLQNPKDVAWLAG